MIFQYCRSVRLFQETSIRSRRRYLVVVGCVQMRSKDQWVLYQWLLDVGWDSYLDGGGGSVTTSDLSTRVVEWK